MLVELADAKIASALKIKEPALKSVGAVLLATVKIVLPSQKFWQVDSLSL